MDVLRNQVLFVLTTARRRIAPWSNSLKLEVTVFVRLDIGEQAGIAFVHGRATRVVTHSIGLKDINNSIGDGMAAFVLYLAAGNQSFARLVLADETCFSGAGKPAQDLAYEPDLRIRNRLRSLEHLPQA